MDTLSNLADEVSPQTHISSCLFPETLLLFFPSGQGIQDHFIMDLDIVKEQPAFYLASRIGGKIHEKVIIDKLMALYHVFFFFCMCPILL